MPASAFLIGAATLPYRISTRRLLLLTLLSNGVYLYYWFYVTWRQYRDHTGNRVFPGWHTLALGIPVYGLFHVHEHMTAYNRLMLQPRLPTTINAILVVALMLVSGVLTLGAAVLSIISAFPIGFLSEPGPTDVQPTLIKLGFDAVNIIIAAGLLVYVQQKLNAYWESLPEVQVSSGKLGWGEFGCVIIGILDWATAAITIMGVG